MSEDCETPQLIMERLKRLDTRIESQYSQIHNRYTTFLVSQGFLFTSFALAISRGIGDFKTVWWVLVIGLPIMGLVSVWMSQRSINAHKDFVSKLKEKRRSLENIAMKFKFEETEAAIDTYYHQEGLKSTTYPITIFIFWCICLIALIASIWPIEINFTIDAQTLN